MHNIVLHISIIYLFPWLHALCDPSPINDVTKHAILAKFIICVFLDISFCWVVCLNVCSYAHNASMKMTLCVMAFNILTFTPT